MFSLLTPPTFAMSSKQAHRDIMPNDTGRKLLLEGNPSTGMQLQQWPVIGCSN